MTATNDSGKAGGVGLMHDSRATMSAWYMYWPGAAVVPRKESRYDGDGYLQGCRKQSLLKWLVIDHTCKHVE